MLQRLARPRHSAPQSFSRGKRATDSFHLQGNDVFRTHPVQKKHVFMNLFPHNFAPLAERHGFLFLCLVSFFRWTLSHSNTSAYTTIFTLYTSSTLTNSALVFWAMLSVTRRQTFIFYVWCRFFPCLLIPLFFILFRYSSTNTMSQATLANHLPPTEPCPAASFPPVCYHQDLSCCVYVFFLFFC